VVGVPTHQDQQEQASIGSESDSEIDEPIEPLVEAEPAKDQSISSASHTEEIPRPASQSSEIVQLPIQVKVDAPSCSITVTTSGIQTRSRTKNQPALPPAETVAPKDKVKAWIGDLPKPVESAVQQPGTTCSTRRGREIKKPVIFDPAAEDRRQKEMRASMKQKSEAAKARSSSRKATVKEQPTAQPNEPDVPAEPGPKPSTKGKSSTKLKSKSSKK
jgi:hypothetical protein